MSKSTSVLFSIFLTAIVVGGAGYLWAKGEISSLSEEIESIQKTEEVTGSIVEEDRSYDDMWLSFGDLSFNLPEAWSESQAMQGSEGVKVAYISVPDLEYDVQLKMTMTEGTTSDEDQEPPENLDAPWMPSTEVTRDELVQFIL